MDLKDSYKATVISLFPLEIISEKSGLIPPNFVIPASKDMDPTHLVIGECMHYVYLDVDRGYMPVRDPAIQVAESIVNDYINASLGVQDRIHAAPGLLAMPGVVTGKQFKADYEEEYDKLKVLQINWAKELIKMADDDWQKYHKHNVISNIQRLFAIQLNYKAEWVRLDAGVQYINCPLCRTAIRADSVVCAHCRAVINEEEYKKHRFADKELVPVGLGPIVPNEEI